MTLPATPTASAEPLRRRTPPGLLPDARCVVLPDGIVSSGGPALISTCQQLGITFDPWQVDAVGIIGSKNAAGLYAADTVVLSIPRQVGKTFLVGAVVFADCIAHPGTLTVWTAHRFKVARETFDELRAIAESDALAPHIDRDAITTAAGNEVIPFRNGSRIVFAARERGSIRGFRKVRRLILDEAQILSDAALSDLAPTQNQAWNPQIILMGTPPKPSDPGEAFTRLRDEAMSGEADGVAYVEFAADAEADIDDRAAWRQANPSYPRRTPERAMTRLRRLLADDDFMREVMGVWTLEQSRTSAINPVTWSDLADPAAEYGQSPVYAVATAPDRDWTALAAAWRRPDGRSHVVLLDYKPGTDWVAGAVVDRRASRPGKVIVDTASRGLVADAEQPSGQAQAQAHNALWDAVAAGQLTNGDERAMTVAVRASRWKPQGDTRVLDRKGDADISPIVAASLAAREVLAAKPHYAVGSF